MKKKIAIIGLKGLPAYGGAASVGESIVSQLSNEYDFTVYSVNSHTSQSTGNYGNICRQIVFKSYPYRIINVLLYYIKAGFHTLGKDYDMVHLHHREAAFILPIISWRYPVILTVHGMELTDKWNRFSSLFNLFDTIFLRFATNITVVSKKDLSFVSKIYSERKIMHIPNGIDIQEINAKPESRFVFAAGRIVESKGCHVFLDAMVQNSYNHKIDVIGDYKQIQKYGDSLLQYKNHLPNLCFAGLIPEKSELLLRISRAKLFIYPSVIESMSMMLLEVGSIGVPMLVCRIRENLDIFGEDEVQYFNPGDSGDLNQKIEWCLAHYPAMVERAKKLRARLNSDYYWGRISQQYSGLFKATLK